MTAVPFDLHGVAERGRKIYDKYRRDLEARNCGRFVVIDVRSEKLFLGDTPEDAYREARQSRAEGPFHVARVGEAAVYRSTRPSGWRRRRAR